MSAVRRHRILFIVPSLSRGGAETQLIALINGLDATRFDKHLLTFSESLDQLERVDLAQTAFHKTIRRYKYDFGFVREISSIIDDNDIDTVHCTLQIALLMGWLAIRLSRRKPLLVVAEHTTVNRNLKYELHDRLLYQWLMRACDKVVFVCDTQRKHWEQKYPFLRRRSIVVHNGVDADFFERSSHIDAGLRLLAEADIPRGAAIAACIARFDPEKAHRDLMTAFRDVARRNRDAYLLLAGDGPLRLETESLARELRISSRVRFLGKLADVRPLLAVSSILVVSSVAVETFSIAMLESMSMSVPVVSTTVGGAAEAVIPGRTGWLVPPGDTAALGVAIANALADLPGAAKLGTSARQMVCDCFTRERMVHEMERLFDSLGV